MFFFSFFAADECRIILFEEPIPNMAIKGHVIRSGEVLSEGSCRTMCYMEPNCVSINVQPLQGGKYKCELNNATVDERKLTFLQETDAYYLAIEVNALLQVKFHKRRIQRRIINRFFL